MMNKLPLRRTKTDTHHFDFLPLNIAEIHQRARDKRECLESIIDNTVFRWNVLSKTYLKGAYFMSRNCRISLIEFWFNLNSADNEFFEIFFSYNVYTSDEYLRTHGNWKLSEPMKLVLEIK